MKKRHGLIKRVYILLLLYWFYVTYNILILFSVAEGPVADALFIQALGNFLMILLLGLLVAEVTEKEQN
ncbi:MAG: hypothetical protein BAJATHORv1_10241 [Candidatus Thorarchaeota archaeon]|nr:MAG: hypothetical protein BAJATHORv1_10241 [Candidatus Thorarchaeota archaeon]